MACSEFSAPPAVTPPFFTFFSHPLNSSARALHSRFDCRLDSLLSCPVLQKPKKKKKNTVRTLTLTPPDYECTERFKAGKTDGVTVNYRGSLTSEGTVFEDSFKVGRPMDVTLGQGSVIAGWEMGIPGMCVGETRRIFIPPQFAYGEEGQSGKIPPNAHLTFDVELLAVDGKDVTALRAEERAGAAAKDDDPASDDAEPSISADASFLDVDGEDVLARRRGERESPFCDACSTVLEEFYGAWVTTMMKQINQAEARDGGAAPPAVTYNDDTEEMVQGFCTNRSTSRINVAPPVYGPHVKQACHRIMKLKKRELVGQFLSAELDGRILPEKNAVVCGEWMGACPRVARGKTVGGKCGVCRAMVEDLAFEARRAAPTGTHLSAATARDMTRKNIAGLLDEVCQNSYYRRPLKRDDVDLCEDFVDDHKEVILDAYVGGGGGLGIVKGGSRTLWLEVARKVCVEEAEVCKSSKVTAENFMVAEAVDPAREEL